MITDPEKRLPAYAENKRLSAGNDGRLPSLASEQEPDGRELLKNIGTLEEYYNLTTSYGHDPNEPQDYTNPEEPQDKNKRFHKKEE